MKQIMSRAWEIYKELIGDHVAKLAQALRMAWAERKSSKTYKDVIAHLVANGWRAELQGENDKTMYMNFYRTGSVRVHYSVWKNIFEGLHEHSVLTDWEYIKAQSRNYDACTKTIEVYDIPPFQARFKKKITRNTIEEFLEMLAEQTGNRSMFF